MNREFKKSTDLIIEDRIKKFEQEVSDKFKKETDIRGESFQLYSVNTITGTEPSKIKNEQRIDKSGREYLMDFIFFDSLNKNAKILCVQTAKYSNRGLSDLYVGIEKILLNEEKIDNPKLEKIRKFFWKNKESFENIKIFCCTTKYSEKINEGIRKQEDEINNKIKSQYPNLKIQIIQVGNEDFLTYEKQLLIKNIGKYNMKIKDKQQGIIKNNFSDGLVKNVCICLVDASSLINIYKRNEEKLFYLNIRNDLGRNSVNQNIQQEIESGDNQYFWCFNNGLTIICDAFDRKTTSSDFIICNPVIVNGQQTIRTLSKIKLKNTNYILCKIVVTSSIKFIEKITETTNSQTKINYQDLKSNHPYLLAIEEIFLMNNLSLKRKKGKLPASTRKENLLFRFNTKEVAQSVLSIVMNQPHIGRLGKDKILFDEYFEDIFSRNYEEILLSALVYANVKNCIKKLSKERQKDNNLANFIWHICCKIYREDKNKKVDLNCLIQKHKENSPINIELIEKIHYSMNNKVPREIKDKDQIGSYLNKEESLKLI